MENGFQSLTKRDQTCFDKLVLISELVMHCQDAPPIALVRNVLGRPIFDQLALGFGL